MSETSGNNYVTKDLWDESLKRIEQTSEANLRRMEYAMEANLAKHDAIANEIRGEIKNMNTRIDQLQHFHYWELAWFSIVLAVIAYFAHS